ncbi:MAG: NAD-dependent epimerase/dehydratase family protein [Lacisediminihabitans sp.]
MTSGGNAGNPVAGLLHDGAKLLAARNLRDDDRILVIGASGWFGRTATALLNGLSQPRLLMASRARPLRVGHLTVACEAWDWQAVREFSPTVVIDCAFLTRDLVGTMGLDEYVDRNSRLTQNFIATVGLPTVAKVITISSGAAVYPVDALTQSIEHNPYGYLKRDAEQRLADFVAHRRISGVVARAWSVSGAFVQKPHSYALTDMILQAQAGRVHISASSPVYRRYVSVEDLLAVALASGLPGATPVIDSGGELVEMQELAETVVSIVNPAATITRAEFTKAEPNLYYAAADGWNATCSSLSFTPADLGEQIRIAQAGLDFRF